MPAKSKFLPGQVLIIVAGCADTDADLVDPSGPEAADAPYHFFRMGTLVEVQEGTPWGGAQFVARPVDATPASWSKGWNGDLNDTQVLFDFHARLWTPPPTDINDIDAWLNEEGPCKSN